MMTREPAAPNTKAVRVLIVEDDAQFRWIFFRFMQARAAFDCVAVATGAEALPQCLAHSPDVILLDLRLGDTNGFEVLRRLHADVRTAAIPVILYTGEARSLDLLDAAARSSNAFAFLHKPFDFETAADLIRKAAAAPVEDDPADLWTVVRAPLHIDLRLRRVTIDDNELPLGPKRFDCLAALARTRTGLSLPLLRAMVWGSDLEPLDSVVKTVERLREDLRLASGFDLVVPIPGGYRLE